jgi:peptidoglycan-N-acetylglucosamine deacetylase
MPFRVALTFDAEHPDRPHRVGGTERVLDRLDADGVTATFFLQGRWAEAYPALARSVAERGHLVGNHSFYHARMPLLSPSGLVRDVRAAERAIIAATGVDPRPWFRCPFGAGTHDPAVLAGLARLGYREIRWDVGGDDWHASRSGAGLARDLVAAAVERGDGAVVLLHPWTRATGLGLGQLIAGLRDAGASFVRLDALG